MVETTRPWAPVCAGCATSSSTCELARREAAALRSQVELLQGKVAKFKAEKDGFAEAERAKVEAAQHERDQAFQALEEFQKANNVDTSGALQDAMLQLEKLQRKVGLTILSKPPPWLALLLRVCVQRCGHRSSQHHILSRQSPRPLHRQRHQPRWKRRPLPGNDGR